MAVAKSRPFATSLAQYTEQTRVLNKPHSSNYIEGKALGVLRREQGLQLGQSCAFTVDDIAVHGMLECRLLRTGTFRPEICRLLEQDCCNGRLLHHRSRTLR